MYLELGILLHICYRRRVIRFEKQLFSRINSRLISLEYHTFPLHYTHAYYWVCEIAVVLFFLGEGFGLVVFWGEGVVCCLFDIGTRTLIVHVR